MSKRDYYEVLGVHRECQIEDVKAAYRKLAKELHPDRNPGDQTCEHKFKEINEAYDVLKDPDKRAAYDRFGHAAFDGGMGGRGPAGFDFSASFTDVFDDLFGEFMGAKRTRRQNRGGDLRYNLEITLEDAYRGKTAEIRVPSLIACADCGGIGAAPGTKPETCSTCSGHGKVRATQGFFTVERTCPKCRGHGRVVRHPCKTCNGSGHVQKERTLAVDIPPGVEEGTRIRLSGEGQAGFNGGPPGDLYIFLSVSPGHCEARPSLVVTDGGQVCCSCSRRRSCVVCRCRHLSGNRMRKCHMHRYRSNWRSLCPSRWLDSSLTLYAPFFVVCA